MGLGGDFVLISIWATFVGIEPEGLGLFSYGGASITEKERNEENVSFRGCPLITNIVWEGGQGGVVVEENRIHSYNWLYWRIEVFLLFSFRITGLTSLAGIEVPSAIVICVLDLFQKYSSYYYSRA